MKRRIAVFGALFALMLFSSISALAQGTDSNIDPPFVIAGPPIDPLEIEGIRIIEPGDPIVIEAFETVYLNAGLHWARNNASIGEGAKVFYDINAFLVVAPGEQLTIGKPGGEIVQLQGQNRSNDTYGLIVAGNVDAHGLLISGFHEGILFMSDDENLTFYADGLYITDNRKGISIDEIFYNTEGPFAWSGQGEKDIRIDNSYFWGNKRHMNLEPSGARANFFASDTYYLEVEDKQDGRRSSLLYLAYNDPSPYTVQWVDCFFLETPWLDNGKEYQQGVWPTEEAANNRVIVEETRPGGIDGERMVTLWPRDIYLLRTDITGNGGVVELSDFLYVAADYGSKVGATKYAYVCDIDISGVVDMPDLKAVARDYFGIPEEYALSDLIHDSEMLASLEERVFPLLEALNGYPAVKDAVMADPEFGPFIQAYLDFPTAVSEVAGETPDEFMLSQNYPNPFNSQTVIRFCLPDEAAVMLTIHNTAGQVVARLVDEVLPAGVYTQQWDGMSNSIPVASGTYFYRILVLDSDRGSAGEYVQVNKMLLLR